MDTAAAVDSRTRGFYHRFKTQRERFIAAIQGIADGEQRARYAALLFSRLMFIYFLQCQGLLAGDPHYLRNRLAMVRARDGDVQGHPFYREFLFTFFHRGMNQPEAARLPEVAALIGEIPYANSGLLGVHQIEASNSAITIPDTAFARIFEFFDSYEWRLDDRPPRNDNDHEITPDVLGYVFERHTNQKQMGAYYTGEDVAGYIGRNTIIPYLLDAAREDCPSAFAPDGGEVWRLPRDDPDRYIYEAVRHGVDEPLPAAIAAGLDDVSRRGGWNRPADSAHALPTETWREHIARRTHCLELRARLAAGEITQVNDLITENLDIERFARDVIARCEGPELLRAFWRALTGATILDPTCGSGAFLLAALDILAPLYEACLDRMRVFVAALDRAGGGHESEDFRRVLAQVAAHPNRRYYVLKTIIANNLYGVDLMEDACEIVRLRLFLKLAAQVEDASRLEPLPNLGGNIRAGNALTGRIAPCDVDRRPPRRDRDLPFEWCVEFPAVMAAGGFDVIVGNPPYVEHSSVRGAYTIAGYETAACGNLYAFVCERALQLLSTAGRLGVIVPLSSIATQRMRPLQDVLFDRGRQAWVSAFDVYPSKLFDGAKQRLTILLLAARDGDGAAGILSMRYMRWKPAERSALFASLTYHAAQRDARLGVVPKLGDRTAAGILRKLAGLSPAPFVASLPSPSFYVHRIPYNYVKAVDFVPFFWNAVDGLKKSEDYKPYYLTDPQHARIMLAVLNSNLFFWWWYTLFEGYHCGRHEVHSFPIGLDRLERSVGARLAELGQALMADLKRNAARREATYAATGMVRYDELYPRRSKALLDQIDAALAPHYGLTDAELDAVVNFDVKYRVNGGAPGGEA